MLKGRKKEEYCFFEKGGLKQRCKEKRKEGGLDVAP